MSFFWTCPYCEANLDHGEKCDCQELKIISQKHHKHLRKFINNLEDMKDGRLDEYDN